MSETQTIGMAISEALGLKDVYYLQITCEVGKNTTLNVGKYVFNDDAQDISKKLKKVMSKYTLKEVDV